MIKALFLDLDGTLLNSNRKLSENTKAALEVCRTKGIKIFVATARPPLLKNMLCLSPEEEKLLSDGGIFYNGGCICCDNLKEYSNIPKMAVNKTIEIASFYSDVNVALQAVDEKHSFRFELIDTDYPLWGINKKDVMPFIDFPEIDVVKVVIFTSSLVFSPQQLPSDLYEKINREVSQCANVYLTDKGKCIQVVNKNISKKSAIEQVRAKYKFGIEEIAVFGDDFTDIEMLKEYKFSFAMGNAIDEVKSIAKYLTKSNNEDGVYHALKDILLLL